MRSLSSIADAVADLIRVSHSDFDIKSEASCLKQTRFACRGSVVSAPIAKAHASDVEWYQLCGVVHRRDMFVPVSLGLLLFYSARGTAAERGNGS